MKKLSFFALLFIGITFYSCSDESTSNNPIDNNTKRATLAAELQEYNANFSSNLPKNQTRGWGGWVNCALADWGGCMIGAQVGGMIGGPHGAAAGAIGVGAIASIAVAWGNEITMPEPNKAIYNIDNFYNYVGEDHNKIMETLYKEKDLYLINGSIDSIKLFRRIQTILIDDGYDVDHINSVDVNILRNKTFIEVTTVDENELFSETAITKRINILTEAYPENKEQYQIMRDYLITTSKISDRATLDQYSKGYENIVIKSNISEVDKSIILSTTALTKNSLSLW